MAKRKRNMTPNKFEKLIQEGRGQGRGQEYKPWLLIQDVPSKGRSSRIKGIKTKRQHEFLSDMERNYFYILEYSNPVVDIREKYPLLPLEETLLIAQELGIKHPVDPKTNEYIVMTTDFLVTMKKNNKNIDVARTIKSFDDLMNFRTIEKYAIEKQYWKKREIEWGLITENEIDNTVAKNISYIHSYYDLKELDSLVELNADEIEDLILEYIRRIISGEKSIRNISSKFDNDMFLEKGTGISLFKHLLINKRINIDIFAPININKVIHVDLVNSSFDKEWKVL